MVRSRTCAGLLGEVFPLCGELGVFCSTRCYPDLRRKLQLEYSCTLCCPVWQLRAAGRCQWWCAWAIIPIPGRARHDARHRKRGGLE